MLTRFNRLIFRTMVLYVLTAALVTLPLVVRSANIECSTSLRRLIQMHNFPLAFHCAELHFEINLDDMDALLVMARAAQELGRPVLADTLAKQSRAGQLTTAQRFAAYLISGISHTSRQNLTTAKILLYRASDFARSEPEMRVVRRTLVQISRLSPWNFNAGIDVSPSTNINNGSLHDTIIFGGLEFELDEESKAQSGIAYSVSAGVAHQRRLSARMVWENKFTVVGTAYDGRGRNEASYAATSGLQYTPETVRPMLVYGYVRYNQRYIADEIGTGAFSAYGAYYNQATAGLELHRNPDQTSSWKVYGTLTDRSSDTSADQNVQIGTLGTTYRFALNSGVKLAFGGYVQTTAGASTLAAQASNISLGGSWDPEDVPFSFSGNLAYTHTQYTSAAFGYSEARVDDDVKLELAISYDNLQLFGFKPTFGVLVSRDYSNLNRYDTQTKQMFTRLSAAF